jgi:Mg2+/Co2+ transporter CorB
MQNLLSHSTVKVAGIMLPALEIAAVREIVEIGVEEGAMTRLPLYRNRRQCCLGVLQRQDQSNAQQAA